MTTISLGYRILSATAIMLTIAIPAMAVEKLGQVGNTISISYNNGVPAVGCTNPKDAEQANRLWLRRDALGLRDFVEWVGHDNENRRCLILNTSASNTWKIVYKIGGNKFDSWYCLESTIDFGPASESKRPAECFWIWMLNK
jgi:hypothetical protein